MTHDTPRGRTASSPVATRHCQARTRSRNTHPRGRRHALAWAAAAALCAPAAHALDVFTANAPVYLASWFNGSYTETHEFQYGADWAGFCNAHANSNCQSIAYWNVAGNWDGNAIPNAASGDARVELGRTVRVGGLNSVYRGYINDYAAVNTLSAAGRVEISGGLRVANASFADLYLFVGGRLDTTGWSTVHQLSSGLGTFGGAGGTTQMLAWSPNTLGMVQLLVNDGHTLNLAGGSTAPVTMELRLNPGARLVNQGVLDLGGGFVELQGTANVFTLPVFDNSGTLNGTGSLASVRFNNAGTVALGDAGALAMAIGTHSGSFTGGAASTLTVGGVFAGVGHQFLAGSSVNSGGDVVISKGNHQVAGSWDVARMRVQGNGQIDFNGPAPHIGALRLEADSSLNKVRFNSAGVALGSATIANGRVEFNAADSTVQALTLQGGVVAVDGHVHVTQTLDWHSGWLTGGGTLRLPGLVTLHAGTRGFALGGRADLDGTIDWQAGNFSQWSGHLTVLPSGRVNIGGDFSSAGGGGSLFNWGAVTKQAGSGRAELGMAVNSDGGLFRALAGTLALTGGGVHNDATFDAAPGARIELAGGTVFGRSVTVSGPLDVAGGSFELLTGVQYAHAAGNRFEGSDVRIGSGARLQLAGALNASGSVHNAGRLDAGGAVNIGIDFNQYGSFTLAPGAALSVGGWFTNGTALTLTDSPLAAGTLLNPSTLTLTGAVSASVGQLQNTGTLAVVPGPAGGMLSLGGGLNSGVLRLDGAANTVSVSGTFVNTGHIVNEGAWYAGASFLHGAGARMDNAGLLNVTGDLGLQAGSLLTNAGSVVANGGTPPSPDDPLGVPSRVIIDAGASLAGAGSFTQLGGLTVVNGLLRADAGVFIDGGTLQGSGTVQGPVTVGQDALWRLGNSPGTFTVVGDATLNGRLEVEVQSLAVHDRLVVSGSFNAWAPTSVIDIVFDPAFQPADGDAVHWLQAGAANVSSATVNFNGLPAYWSAAFDPNNAGVALTYDLAVAIPLSGDHAIPWFEVGYNASTNSNNPPSLNRLYNQGTFSNRGGALANISTLDNEGTVNNRGTLWTNVLNNGVGGSFHNRAGGALSAWALNNDGSFVNEGAVDVHNWVRNAPGAVLEQRGTMTLHAPLYNGGIENYGRLVVAGTLGGVPQIINRGQIVIEPGGVLQGGDGGGVFNQYAGDDAHLRVDGLLAMRNIDLNAGRLSGSGRLQGNVGGYARIEPGNSVGTLTVEGNLWAQGGVDFEIASATSYDRLVVTGDADVAWSTFYLLGDYRPVLGDHFGVLPVAGTLLTGSWAVYRQVNPLDASQGWTVWATADAIYDPNVPAAWRAVFADGTLSITAVPEPGTWALWLAGCGALGSVVVRRRRMA